MDNDKKALADRLLADVNSCEAMRMPATAALLREAAAALTSPQADKARGEVDDVGLYGPSLAHFGQAYEEASCVEGHWPTGDSVFEFVQERAEDIAREEATPQPQGSASETLCVVCGQPTMHLGNVCYACSHPQLASPEEVKAQDSRPPLPRLALPEHVGMLMGPDDCPRLLLNEVEIAVFPAGTWGEVCDALNFGGYVNPDSTPQARPDGGEAIDDATIFTLAAESHYGSEPCSYWDMDRAALLNFARAVRAHPAPAPDVARLVEATSRAHRMLAVVCPPVETRELVNDVIEELGNALEPFTAAQQGATNGQE